MSCFNQVSSNLRLTYGSKTLGTIEHASLTSSKLEQFPFSSPLVNPIFFNTSKCVCISKVLSKFKEYSFLNKIR